MLTMEEQERLAYIQGDLAKAELLRVTLDAFATIEQVVDESVDMYQWGWNEGHDVGFEAGKEADTEGGSCD